MVQRPLCVRCSGMSYYSYSTAKPGLYTNLGNKKYLTIDLVFELLTTYVSIQIHAMITPHRHAAF